MRAAFILVGWSVVGIKCGILTKMLRIVLHFQGLALFSPLCNFVATYSTTIKPVARPTPQHRARHSTRSWQLSRLGSWTIHSVCRHFQNACVQPKSSRIRRVHKLKNQHVHMQQGSKGQGPRSKSHGARNKGQGARGEGQGAAGKENGGKGQRAKGKGCFSSWAIDISTSFVFVGSLALTGRLASDPLIGKCLLQP